MANVKISELPQTTRLQSTDIVASVSGSTTTKITVKNLADSLTQVSSSISASIATSAATASYVNTLRQNVGITGSLVVDSTQFNVDTITAYVNPGSGQAAFFGEGGPVIVRDISENNGGYVLTADGSSQVYAQMGYNVGLGPYFSISNGDGTVLMLTGSNWNGYYYYRLPAMSGDVAILPYSGSAGITGSLTVTGSVNVKGPILISGSIVPQVTPGTYTSSFSLGSPTNAWKDIYVSDGTIFFTDPGNGQTSTLSVKSGSLVSSGSGQINSGSIIHRTAAGTFTARTDQMSGSKIFGDSGAQTNAMLPEGYEVYNLFNALQYNGQSIVYLYGITNPSNGALKSPLSTSPIRIVNRKAGYPVMSIAINQIDQANGINFTEAGSTLNTTASIYLPTGSYVDLYVETEASGYSGDSWVIVGSGSLESLPSTTPLLAVSASYALTASFVNNLNQNVTITGSLNISGSSTSIVANNGYVVLTQVSRSLNFTDDTAAAAGGVPLGGLYRNGNFIVIRLS